MEVQTRAFAFLFLLGHRYEPVSPEQRARDISNVIVPQSKQDALLCDGARDLVYQVILSLMSEWGVVPSLKVVENILCKSDELEKRVTQEPGKSIVQELNIGDYVCTALAGMIPIEHFLYAEGLITQEPDESSPDYIDD